MRPHKLIMEAFGSFADKTIIDFDKLGNGLYLITGETGSGKTTIFDAICFALFGQASGDGRSKDQQSLYCDFCSKDPDKSKKNMLVELTFSEKGHSYRVEREMKWGKRGKAKKGEFSSVLYDVDASTDGNNVQIAASTKTPNGMNGAQMNDVTVKIMEILSLDANQFSQIVMLAQGEFSKFIKSNATERSEILGRICDNSMYKDFENIIKQVTKNLEERNDSQMRGMTAYLTTFGIEWQEDKKGKIIGNPFENDNNIALMESMLKEIKKKENQLNSQKITVSEGLQTKIKECEKAKHNNEKINKLELQQKEMTKLEAKKPEMEQLQYKNTLAGNAGQVLPSENKLLDSKDAFENTKKDEKKLNKKVNDASNAKSKAEDAKKDADKKQPDIESLQTEINNLSSVMKFYEPLEINLQKQDVAIKKKNTLEEQKKESEAERDKTKATIESNQMQLEKLANANESDVQLKENQVQELKKKCSEFDVLIDENFNEIAELQCDLDKKIKESLKAQKDYAEAEQDYNDKYTRFCASQSILLAEKLKVDIIAKGKAKCPVCGVVHEKDNLASDEANFANEQNGDKAVTNKELEAAKNKVDKRRDKQGKIDNEARDAVNELSNKKKNVLKQVKELADIEYTVDNWQNFITEGMPIFEKKRQEVHEDLENEQSELKKLKAASEKKKKLEKSQKDLNDRLKKQEEAFSNLIKQLDTVNDELTKINLSVTANQQTIKHNNAPATRAEADAMVSGKEKALNVLKRAIEDATEDLKKKSTDFDTAKGEHEKAVEQLKAAENLVGKNQEEFKKAIAENGFATEDDYSAALLDAKGNRMDARSLKKYIDKNNNDIKSFEKDFAACQKQLKESAKAAEGLIKVEVDALEANIEEQNKQLNILDNSIKDTHAHKERMLEASNKLEEGRKKLAGLSRAYSIAKWVYDKTANKEHISQYVLEQYFKSILQQANEHLQILTSGGYVLREKPDDKKNAKDTNDNVKPLDFILFDTSTNSVRDVTKLSGGETFETALAMALGLSDMVQLSGGSQINIDSMFIDEGFGSLGVNDVDKAVKTLARLTEGNRQIGIISHVARLEDTIPNQFLVSKDRETGSHIIIKS